MPIATTTNYVIYLFRVRVLLSVSIRGYIAKCYLCPCVRVPCLVCVPCVFVCVEVWHILFALISLYSVFNAQVCNFGYRVLL